MSPFNIHICRWDPECRLLEGNQADRVYLNTPLGSLIVALERDSWTQGWLPFKGYIDSWWPVVWHPKRSTTKDRSIGS